jgi:hypothetical protein
LLVPLPVEVALTRRLWHPIYSGPQMEDTELCHTWAVRRPFDLLQNSRMRDASCMCMRSWSVVTKFLALRGLSGRLLRSSRLKRAPAGELFRSAKDCIQGLLSPGDAILVRSACVCIFGRHKRRHPALVSSPRSGRIPSLS